MDPIQTFALWMRTFCGSIWDEFTLSPAGPATLAPASLCSRVVVRTHKPLHHSEPVLGCPIEVMLDMGTVVESLGFDIRPDLSDEHHFFLFLINARHDSDSFWWPYVSVLPAVEEGPLFWNDDERQHLEGTSLSLVLEDLTRAIRKDWLATMQKLRRLAKEKSLNVDADAIELEDWQWAWMVWRLRASLDLHNRPCLFPMLELAACNTAPNVELRTRQEGYMLVATADLKKNSRVMLSHRNFTAIELMELLGQVPSVNPNSKHVNQYSLRLQLWDEDPYLGKKINLLRLHSMDSPWRFELSEDGEFSRELKFFLRLAVMDNRAYEAAKQQDPEKSDVFEPISQLNEVMAYKSLISQLEQAINFQPHTIKEDIAALAKRRKLEPRHAKAVAYRLGEKRVLKAALRRAQAELDALVQTGPHVVKQARKVVANEAIKVM
eukprot:CAMPEP_0177642568 /NCGR_PEP_ID=MMETSP0447-20121125/7655_1 /TAXON_ID=0 /ORGANISM="Stygamoeba regulata, Strain BSH-02190019" /LENGTH=435 /DNA_ID=CAMNT_0019144733 /DNA_START=119 /DNA_END=1426 /DNA_ORIENTATION=-